MYLALKAHFQTDEYDVIKMRGRIRASRKSFDGLGKEFAFRRLVKLYDREESVCNFMLSNFVTGNHWGGVFDIEAAKTYQAWQRRNQSLGYVFKQELEQLFNEAAENDISDIFQHTSGTHPYILRAYLRKTIGPETLVILNRIENFVDVLDLPEDDPVWPDIRRLIRKYTPFIKINLEKFIEIYHGFRARG